jgi:hypothetical protein
MNLVSAPEFGFAADSGKPQISKEEYNLRLS